MKSRSLLVLILLCMTLVACVSQEPAANSRNVQSETYLIAPGDQLEIKFFYTPELNEKVAVRPDGVIGMQLIGDVHVAGKSPEEATALLQRRYSSELVDPKIDVLVRSFARQRVFVDGQVGRPGVVELVGPLTVAQAIASGGGMLSSARTTSVLIIRHTEPHEPPKVIVVNLKNILKHSPSADDITLHPYDIVYIPNSRIGNVNKFVDLYLRRNLPMYFGLSWLP